MSNDIGSYYIKTQQEIEVVKTQLIKLKSHSTKNIALQQQYNLLNDNLKELEHNLQSVNKEYYNQIVNNFGVTAQRLPTVEKSNQRNSEQYDIGSHYTLPVIDQMLNVRTMPQVNVEPIGKSYLKPQGIHNVKSAVNIIRKKNVNKESVSAKVNDQTIHKKGLISLVNQGTLEREDVSQFFNKNNQMMSFSQVNLHKYPSGPIKQTVQMEGISNQILYKTDFKDSLPKSKQFLSEKESATQLDSFSQATDKSKLIITTPTNEVINKPEQIPTYMIEFRDGELVKDSQQFQGFYRFYYEEWSVYEPFLRSLEKIVKESKISYACLLSDRIVKLKKQMDIARVFSLQELIEAFDNWEELALALHIPSMIYKTRNGKELAIVKIQSLIRGFKARKDYLRLRMMVHKVKIIQQAFRISVIRNRTTQKVINKNELMIQRFKSKQSVFKDEWAFIKIQKRYEIHIGSLQFEELKRLSMDKFAQRQNVQITRIFNLKDPLVNIIYIAPFNLPSEVMEYCYKILTLGDIPDCRSRLHFIWPENHHTFPNHMSITSLMLYSPKAVKRVKQLIRGNAAYIVPGLPSNEEIKLADLLNCPIFSGLPQLHQLYSSKSGSKSLFEEQSIPQPIGIRNIYGEKELINSLSVLICKYPNVDTWILKIDDETQGRGIAWIESKKIWRKQQQLPNLNTIVEILGRKLKKRLHITYPQLFKSYQEYMLSFTTKGGIIEASPQYLSTLQTPSVHFRVDPDGDVQQIGVYEKIKQNEYQTIASISPLQPLKVNFEFLCQQLGQKLYSKGLFGYFTFDSLVYQEGGSTKQQFQAIGLDCYLNQYSSALSYFDFLMKGRFDGSNGSYRVDDGGSFDNARHMIYCPNIMNEGLDLLQYKTFFQLCRLESISFNLEKKIGSTFILLDSLQSGIVSLMTVGQNPQQVIKYMMDALMFLQRNVGRGIEQISIDNRSDKINMMGIHQRLQSMLKKLESAEPRMNKYNQYL